LVVCRIATLAFKINVDSCCDVLIDRAVLS